MKSAVSCLRNLSAKYCREERGVSAALVAVCLTALVAMAGFSIDVGHVMWVQRQLQNAVDASALAGASQLQSNSCTPQPSCVATAAASTATSYSSVSGGKNANPNIKATMVGGYPAVKCFTSVSVSCSSGSPPYNGIQVEEQAIVPMWFAQIVGLSQFTVKAAATAVPQGASAQALDVVIVLDTTASMNSADNNCSGGATRVACAKYGAIEIMQSLNPAIDKVSLLVFPGFNTSSEATGESTCSGNPGQSGIAAYAPYNSSQPPYYTIAGLSSTFKSGSSDTLDTSSGPVTAAGGNPSCTGIQAIGGVETDYSQVLLAAQAILAAAGDNNQKVIIFLSDGEANSPHVTGGLSDVDECQQAIAAAQSAASAGTWVYSIAYGSSTAAGSCTTDTTGYTGVNLKNLSACTSMQNIASAPGKFYSDDANGCVGTAGNSSNVDQLFSDVAQSLSPSSGPRLVPNNTT